MSAKRAFSGHLYNTFTVNMKRFFLWITLYSPENVTRHTVNMSRICEIMPLDIENGHLHMSFMVSTTCHKCLVIKYSDFLLSPNVGNISMLDNFTEPVFVNLLRSLGIDSQPGGPVRQPYLT